MRLRLLAEPRQHQTQNQLGVRLYRYIVSSALLYYNQIARRQPALEGADRGLLCHPGRGVYPVMSQMIPLGHSLT
jgi:hypothetical protein